MISSDNGQENANPTLSKPSKTPVRKPNGAGDAEPTSLPKLKPQDVPVTPAGRLALLDLIGMGDAAMTEQDVSPEERLLWDHNKDIIHSSASNYSGMRRVRKRARSSSPVSSSPAAVSRKKPEAQQTPVDPGSDLWGRFSHMGSASHISHAQSASFQSNMLYTSSPQPNKEVATPRTVAGFRRANSCGNQFPKRRRIGHSDDVFTDGPLPGPSKLSVLIERVQEHLTQPSKAATPTGSLSPASSSLVSGPVTSDEDESQPGVEKSTPTIRGSSPRSRSPMWNTPRRQTGHVTAVSSDYGDDDMDESLLDVVGDPSAQPILHAESVHNQQISAHPIVHPTAPGRSPHRGSRSHQQRQPAIVEDEDDEFDDSDVEMFTADMEVLASKYDTPSVPEQAGEAHMKLQHVSTAAGGASLVVQSTDFVGSDDEFGSDGLDESDLAAAELSATQSIQQSMGGLLPVCYRYP